MYHARADYTRIQDPNGNIPEDEPVFLLRGQDRAAPGAIEYWATLAELQGASPEIVQTARDQAFLMRQYQGACTNKVADLPGTEVERKTIKYTICKRYEKPT